MTPRLARFFAHSSANLHRFLFSVNGGALCFVRYLLWECKPIVYKKKFLV